MSFWDSARPHRLFREVAPSLKPQLQNYRGHREPGVLSRKFIESILSSRPERSEASVVEGPALSEPRVHTRGSRMGTCCFNQLDLRRSRYSMYFWDSREAAEKRNLRGRSDQGLERPSHNPFFRPFGACSRATIYPRLAPWALFLRLFAAL